jgi:hypothetical protein
MMTMIAAALAAAQPATPAPAPAMPQHQMQMPMSHESDHQKGMDCCCDHKGASHDEHGPAHEGHSGR